MQKTLMHALLVLLPLCTLAPASAEPAARGDAFWAFGPDDPGNGPIDLGDDGDDDGLPDTIIWCIGGDGEGSQVYDADLVLTLFTRENRIYDAAGTLQCTAHDEGGEYRLRQGVDGAALYTTTLGRHVYDGAAVKPPRRLAHEFVDTRVYDGPRRRGQVATTATEVVERANPMRKLLIAALLNGRCGAAGATGAAD